MRKTNKLKMIHFLLGLLRPQKNSYIVTCIQNLHVVELLNWSWAFNKYRIQCTSFGCL